MHNLLQVASCSGNINSANQDTRVFSKLGISHFLDRCRQTGKKQVFVENSFSKPITSTSAHLSIILSNPSPPLMAKSVKSTGDETADSSNSITAGGEVYLKYMQVGYEQGHLDNFIQPHQTTDIPIRPMTRMPFSPGIT